MSIFNELIPNLFEISNLCAKNFNRELKDALERLDKFEDEFKNQNGRSKARERAQKDKITLQSIDEGEDETNKLSNPVSSGQHSETQPDSQGSNGGKQRLAKKRSKHEVDDISSPEQDKRVKRNASVKALSNISKQVNVNLSQKLRRENSSDKAPERQSSRIRRHKDDEKENLAPQEIPTVQIKQEKISIPSEPEAMETEALSLPPDVEIKRELHKDDIAMPPPIAPVPKPRKGAAKERPGEKSQEEASEEEPGCGGRRSTRTRKPADVTSVTRDAAPPTAEARPKRTRGRKKLSELRADSGNGTQSSAESAPASPAEKPRPKRTRRGQKTDKEEPKQTEPEPIVSPKDERPSGEPQQTSSPILPVNEIKSKNKKGKEEDLAKTLKDKDVTKTKNDKDVAKTRNDKDVAKTKNDKDLTKTKVNGLVDNSGDNLMTSVDVMDNIALNETKILPKAGEMDQTVVLPNGVYNHAPVTPKNIRVNETMVLEKTMILDRPNGIMDATVVLDKGAIPSNLTEDNSLITDDSDSQEEVPSTPAKKGVPEAQPLSAVKEKVQQFEEMASRVTRTKTRAMAKKEEDKETETQTPPERVLKVVISTETLNKMNSLIFNGKPLQVSSSACKPRAAAPPKQVTASASKAAAVSRARDARESEREDARQKKEALLEAKRELQRRKREEKMAAAAAARSAAERERRVLLEAAARERVEKLQHAENEKNRLLREAERKKQELARKVAETEERRRAEESARQQRLAEEQRRAAEQRNKKNEEAEAVRREEARMAKEIEKKQREYNEKMKKQKMDKDKMHTPFKAPHPPLPPVCMEDGFQYLNSDEEAGSPQRPVPAWSSSKVRRQQLLVQKHISKQTVDAWFGVSARSPDLAEIFPTIERARLKRTSSAVWHTPPPAPPARN